jgi:type III pantothenate kinase
MEGFEKALVIDAGNTRIKVAEFHFTDLKEVHSFSNDQLGELKTHLLRFEKIPTIIASVRSEKNTRWLKRLIPTAVLFTNALPLPLTIAYETPQTLGVDRLANVLAAANFSSGNALVIDIGTCVKYDFVDATKTYHGGAISPGIGLRYQSMHTFTGKLPLIEDRLNAPIIGQNTFDAMRSGVMNGLNREIEGFIHEYQRNYPELTIFITGGDSQCFELEVKNGIFADENLTLKGLLIALIHVYT